MEDLVSQNMDPSPTIGIQPANNNGYGSVKSRKLRLLAEVPLALARSWGAGTSNHVTLLN